MKCYSCGHLLPNDSEYCQYCGKRIEKQISNQGNTVKENVEEVTIANKANESAEINLIKMANEIPEETRNLAIKGQEETVNNLEENKKAKRAKNRFCKFCGGQIDVQTKKCSSCGKQYFKGIKTNKFSLIVLILCVVVLASIILNIIQQAKINELNGDKEYYKGKSLDYQTEISNLKEEKVKSDRALKFYKITVAIVMNDGSKKYHAFDCKDLKETVPIWVFSYKEAESRGYYECSKCH